MKEAQAKKRHSELARLIREHNHRYHVLDAPSIPDAEYDGLFLELKAIEREHPALVTPASPTQRVGASPREGVARVEHKTRMFSLDNAYSEEDLGEFDRRVRERVPEGATIHYIAEPKIDGASIEITYEKGHLVLGATRGDGSVGEDVTASVRTMRTLPLDIPDARTFTLRGEVYIHRKDLDAVNVERLKEGEEPFANPRNAASGALRLLDSRLVAQRPLRVAFYDLVEPYFDTHLEMLAGLHALGLPTHRLDERCESIEDAWRYIERFEKKREKLPYDTDGVVLKVDELALRPTLGFTARFPRWATAYKYAAEKARTVVLGIRADVGRTGALTPVADLEPVQVSGTVVSRASLHNIDYVRTKDVRIGDTVTIQKAGEIIPQVLEVDLAQRPPKAKQWIPPTHCPVCETAVVRVEGEAALRCPNAACPGRLEAAVFHFTRRAAMDIDRLGHVLIQQLVQAGLVRDLADVFALPTKRAELLELERMADKSADNVLESIEGAKRGRSFDRLIHGLGIPLVGSVAAQHIAEHFSDSSALLQADPSSVGEALAQIHGIGPKIAESVAEYLGDAQHRRALERMIELGVETRAVPKREGPATGPLGGKSFCVTGTLTEPRENIWVQIEAAGGEIHKTVKKGTTYLVAGDNVGKKKTEAAEKRGTKVIDEAELRRLLT